MERGTFASRATTRNELPGKPCLRTLCRAAASICSRRIRRVSALNLAVRYRGICNLDERPVFRTIAQFGLIVKRSGDRGQSELRALARRSKPTGNSPEKLGWWRETQPSRASGGGNLKN